MEYPHGTHLRINPLLRAMSDDWRDNEDIEVLSKLFGAFIVAVLVWHSFEAVIQPALVSISPIFADQPGELWTGRSPDSPAQVALYITTLLGVFIYILIHILIFDGSDEFINMVKGIPMSIIGIFMIITIVLTETIKNIVFNR
jgi:hypothetical protein